MMAACSVIKAIYKRSNKAHGCNKIFKRLFLIRIHESNVLDKLEMSKAYGASRHADDTGQMGVGSALGPDTVGHCNNFMYPH